MINTLKAFSYENTYKLHCLVGSHSASNKCLTVENYPTKKSLEGSWELISFYSYENDQVIDTIFNSADYRQVKMYAGGKVMWSRKVPMVQFNGMAMAPIVTQIAPLLRC